MRERSRLYFKNLLRANLLRPQILFPFSCRLRSKSQWHIFAVNIERNGNLLSGTFPLNYSKWMDSVIEGASVLLTRNGIKGILGLEGGKGLQFLRYTIFTATTNQYFISCLGCNKVV